MAGQMGQAAQGFAEDCERITQPPAPFHVTLRGLFGPSFLAMLLFEKFGARQPLNRQRDRYAREGVDLSLCTHPIAAASCRGAGVQAAISSAACC